jgi:hypothetical protein
MAIWAALLLAFAIKTAIRWRGIPELWKKLRLFPLFNQYVLLFTIIAIGFIIGLVKNDPATVLADGNAWLYFLVAIPFISYYYAGGKPAKERLYAIFETGVIWLGIKTIILLFLFSHQVGFLPDLYRWVRQSGVGEITAMDGGWMRIFIQSQSFSAIFLIISAFRLVSGKIAAKKDKLAEIAKFSLALATIMLSMSRSFWVALAATAAIAGIYMAAKAKWKKIFNLAGLVLLGLISAAFLIFVIIRFPYPAAGGNFSMKAFSQRTEIGEADAAVVSRWNLLPILFRESLQSPILGQGFGKTVTYQTEDPRLVQSGKSQYTTYAFEWGYLEIMLKSGILGLFAYLWLLYSMLRMFKKQGISAGLGLGVIFLAITHFFTPYLNHPLGIIYIVVCSCLIGDDNVY